MVKYLSAVLADARSRLSAFLTEGATCASSRFVLQHFVRIPSHFSIDIQALAPAPVPPKPTQTPSTPLIRKPIFKSSASSPSAQLADSLSSDGAITQVLAKGPGDAIGLPELFRSASDALGSPARSFTALIKKSKAPTPDAGSFWKNLDVGKFMPLKGSAAAEWWTRERKDKEVRKCLPNRDLDCMAVEGPVHCSSSLYICSLSTVLCTLIAHSFEEDTFGVVQRDIPRALEALLSFLSALEEYQMQLGTLLPVWTAEEEVDVLNPSTF